MYFDGSNDYLLLSSDPAIGAWNFTIESWIYIDATSSALGIYGIFDRHLMMARIGLTLTAT